MKCLILFLVLGATVALGEIHLDNDPNQNLRIRGLSECVLKCLKGNPTSPGKLAEEENDLQYPHRRSAGILKLTKCIRECHVDHKPSKSPPPPTEPGKVADVKNDPQRPRPSFGPDIEKCIRQCIEASKQSDMPSKILVELADEENDPDHARATRDGPTFNGPTFSPRPFLGSCILACLALIA